MARRPPFAKMLRHERRQNPPHPRRCHGLSGCQDRACAAGFEPVRQVAVDEDWSALRFRRAEFIKTLARHPDGAESTLGQARALAAKTKP